MSYQEQADDFNRSHIMIIMVVLSFTMYFFYANRRQGKGWQLLENTVGGSAMPTKTQPG